MKTKTKATIKKLHAAYLAAPGRRDRDDNDPAAPSLRILAKRFGVDFSEADRAATIEHWELERCARASWAWHGKYGGGAKSEEDFVAFFARDTYGHLLADGPEGRALAIAFGRDLWRRQMGPALVWEAARELEHARKAFHALERLRERLATRRAA